MAAITTFVDDLDGTQESVQTRFFSLGSTRYSIDLSEKNYLALAQMLEPYIQVATVVRGANVSAVRGGNERSSARTAARGGRGKVVPVYGTGQAIRDFAASIGAKVPYARPTNDLVRQWIAAHPRETEAWEAQTGVSALEHYA